MNQAAWAASKVALAAGEACWYVVLCINFGFGYSAKIPIAIALSELPQQPPANPRPIWHP